MSIIYPPDLVSRKDKLFATYPLIYQSMQIRNAEAAKARSDPEQYLDKRKGSKFRTYNRIYRQILKKLLFERNYLIETIRADWVKANGPWKYIPQDIEDNLAGTIFLESLFGNRAELELLSTKARAVGLVQGKDVDLIEFLKNLSMENLEGIIVPDPPEDFSTAAWNSGVPQSDPNGNLSLTGTNKINFSALRNDADAFWYRLYDSNGDFEYLVKFYTNDAVSGSVSRCGILALANVADSYYDIQQASGDVQLLMTGKSGGGGDFTAWLYECDGGSEYNDYVNRLDDEMHYAEFERDENVGTYGTLYAYISKTAFWDDGGTQIVTLSIALHTSKKDFDKVFAIMAKIYAASSTNQTGFMQDLNLQGGGGVTGHSQAVIVN